MLDTGKLRAGVFYRTQEVGKGKRQIMLGNKEKYLSDIHEFGRVFKMTDKQRKYLFAVVFT